MAFGTLCHHVRDPRDSEYRARGYQNPKLVLSPLTWAIRPVVGVYLPAGREPDSVHSTLQPKVPRSLWNLGEYSLITSTCTKHGQRRSDWWFACRMLQALLHLPAAKIEGTNPSMQGTELPFEAPQRPSTPAQRVQIPNY